MRRVVASASADVSRLHDPVWQAFEKEPEQKVTSTEEQLKRRQRGLREMRQGLFVTVILLTQLAACTPDAKRALVEYLADKADCAVRNMNLPDDEILKRCAIDQNDAQQILRIVGGARKEAADEAEQARARQQLIDVVAGCPR